MSEPTPGAWRASPDPLVSCVVTGEGTDVTVVAECGERDVQLLAAAPELLEALENIENDDGHIPQAIWDMRNAALAKARGES